ncbi:MAG: serine hydrolase [Nevskia sp.]|nr:serine hydrolase [Nevskia sp.]
MNLPTPARFGALAFCLWLPLACATQAQGAPRAADLARPTEAHLRILARTDDFSGVVLIARDGVPVFRKAYGFSNLADRVPNREDTKFNIASMGKMFTAVAIMQLMESGRLSLDEKVGKYLPDYPNVAVRDSVTIRQLLTHTSGMGNFWEPLDKRAKEQFRTTADYLPLFVDQALLFAPGSSFAYSNSGYMVLGLILERVTGVSYCDYVKEHIYKPAGMKDTDAYELDYVVPNLATGYSRSTDRPGQWTSNTYVNVVKGGPAGGSFSTADDLLAFANALMHFKLLSPQDTSELTTGKVPYGSRMYAYGFTEEISGGHRLIGHGGGNAGIADELMIFTDLGYTAIVLTNGDVDNFWDIQAFIKKRLLGSTPDIESYYFTKGVIDAALKSGYEAGIAALNDKPKAIAVRGGLIEQGGNRLLAEGRNDDAITVFRLNEFAHPEDSSVYANLAEAHSRAGHRDQAIELYKKYLGLEPDDAKAAEKLKELTAK